MNKFLNGIPRIVVGCKCFLKCLQDLFIGFLNTLVRELFLALREIMIQRPFRRTTLFDDLIQTGRMISL